MSWTFFSYFISMEKILQSLVKIIIIGSLFETTFVNCNRQFPSPPIPYIPNQNYFIPGFIPPYAERVPVYYQEPNIPPPISYQNLNSYTPPQLFHQNENYNPSLITSPSIGYPIPQVFPYRPDLYQTHKPEEKIKIEFQQNTYKKPINLHAGPHAEVSRKKPAFYATNIIVKEETHPPYYHDEYNKNYHDEDYSDNYSDDSSPQSDPCLLNSPYKYFESPKPDLNNPNFDNKFVLCNPNLQPTFANGVYTLKMPITLLPSRFPPRVEELIERIQNYFSTYTQRETPNPLNQTSPSTTIQPVSEASSESETYSTATTDDYDKKNKTEEQQEVNSDHTNLEPSELTTVNQVKEVTEETIIVEKDTKKEEIFSTEAPDAQMKKEPQMVIQNTPNPNEITENNPITAEVLSNHTDGFQTRDRHPAEDFKAHAEQTTVSSSLFENPTVKESSFVANDATEVGKQMTSTENPKSEIYLEGIKNKMEELSTDQSANKTLQVNDNNG